MVMAKVERERVPLPEAQGRKTVVIVGGVAGGASCAARLRRQDETAEIIVLEKGPYVSFANCGLPYYIGGVIAEETRLLIADVGLFRRRFNVDARIAEEAIAVDRRGKSVRIRRHADGTEYDQPYDVLVLSPGASPIRPPLPGIGLPGIFSLRTIPDSRLIRDWIDRRWVRHAVVVGGGFIGLEMTENLLGRGIRITLIEQANHLMPALDAEMAVPVADRLRRHAVELLLGDAVKTFGDAQGRLRIETESGVGIDTDMVLLAVGVAPDNALAKACGLALGPRGHILVDNHLRTSDRDIFALGDAVELHDAVIDRKTSLALAGPANRQGRIVADVICGRGRHFRGVQGTVVCGVLGLTLASTGVTEKVLKGRAIDYDVVYAHPGHHVGYYPGAKVMFMKVIFDKSDGRVLGAQAVGEGGIERRIDVIAMAIQMRATVFDLEEAELCYAPQYGAAKDPVNTLGMIAANVMRGDLTLVPWQQMGADGAAVLDVRNADEISCKPVPGGIQIPIDELRGRLDELPRDRPIHICCAVGARAYIATRLLVHRGYDARLLSGGAETWFCVRGCYD